MKKNLYLCILLLVSLLCACGQVSVGQSSSNTVTTWQEQYDLGLRYLSEGNYEEAIIAFSAAIEIDPMQSAAYIGLADAYACMGNYDRAKEAIAAGQAVCGPLEEFSDWLDSHGDTAQAFWREDYTEEQNALVQNLMAAFSNNDIENIKLFVKDEEFRALLGSGTGSKQTFENDFGDTLQGEGLYVEYYDGTPYTIKCYYGGWNDGLFSGQGIVCIYTEPNNGTVWGDFEDWTFTHATWDRGLVTGYCERVRYHALGIPEGNGDFTYVPATFTLSGVTAYGVWNGHVIDEYETDDGEHYGVEADFKYGIPDLVDSHYTSSIDTTYYYWGRNIETGEPTMEAPDRPSSFDNTSWHIRDPATGYVSTSITTDTPEAVRGDVWRIESVAGKDFRKQ